MKRIFALIFILLTNAIFALEYCDSSFYKINDLPVGQTTSYQTNLKSCYSGDRMETMDSINFYRDELGLKAIYRNEIYLIKDCYLPVLNAIEEEFLQDQHTRSTSYYYYIRRDCRGYYLLSMGNNQRPFTLFQFELLKIKLNLRDSSLLLNVF